MSGIVQGINLYRDKAGLEINVIKRQMFNSHRHAIRIWVS